MHRLPAATLPLVLFACGHASPALDVPPQRVIVTFAQARALAATRSLSELGQVSGARVEYLAAISTRSAAYLFHCGAVDPDCADAIGRLTRHSGIAHAELDRREKIR